MNVSLQFLCEARPAHGLRWHQPLHILHLTDMDSISLMVHYHLGPRFDSMPALARTSPAENDHSSKRVETVRSLGARIVEILFFP